MASLHSWEVESVNRVKYNVMDFYYFQIINRNSGNFSILKRTSFNLAWVKEQIYLKSTRKLLVGAEIISSGNSAWSWSNQGSSVRLQLLGSMWLAGIRLHAAAAMRQERTQTITPTHLLPCMSLEVRRAEGEWEEDIRVPCYHVYESLQVLDFFFSFFLIFLIFPSQQTYKHHW